LPIERESNAGADRRAASVGILTHENGGDRYMRIRRRHAVILAVAAAGALAVTGIALASATSTATFSFSPNKVPKNKYKPGTLKTNLSTTYTNPGNANPGGATERTQIFLDDDFKINTDAARKCNPAAIQGNIPMSQAMAQCGRAKVGSGKATASANGAFTVNGCVLLFNGTNKTLLVFTRVQVSNPSNISCANPSSNTEGNTTVLLSGKVKSASGDFGTQLDVNHIQAAAALPLEIFDTKIHKGSFISGRCHDGNKKWNLKVVWTYNDDSKHSVSKSQTCKRS
jgi:hypothetical protein